MILDIYVSSVTVSLFFVFKKFQYHGITLPSDGRGWNQGSEYVSPILLLL